LALFVLNLGLSVTPTAVNSTSSTIPNGYLRGVFYNKDGQPVITGAQIAYLQSSTGSWQDLELTFTATERGYLQVFVANESDQEVFFDDMVVEHTPQLIVQENHYYPFGMNLAGIEKQGKPEHKFQYMSKEKEISFGLNIIETDWRGYDAALGRFHAIDKMAESMDAITPYHYSFNNPIIMNDPSGLDPRYNEKDGKYYDNGKEVSWDYVQNWIGEQQAEGGSNMTGPWHIKKSKKNGKDHYDVTYNAAVLNSSNRNFQMGSTYIKGGQQVPEQTIPGALDLMKQTVEAVFENIDPNAGYSIDMTFNVREIKGKWELRGHEALVEIVNSSDKHVKGNVLGRAVFRGRHIKLNARDFDQMLGFNSNYNGTIAHEIGHTGDLRHIGESWRFAKIKRFYFVFSRGPRKRDVRKSNFMHPIAHIVYKKNVKAIQPNSGPSKSQMEHIYKIYGDKVI